MIEGEVQVPVMRPKVPTVAVAQSRLQEVADSGLFSNFGPQERELRQRFADRLGVQSDRVATVANATLGISGAVAVLGGERWLVPSFTFAASAAAVLAAGADVVLGDVDEETWTLAALDEAVDGFLPVAPFGAAPEVARWAGHAHVVHDAAASLGAEIDLSALPAGHAVVFSLHATKVLGSGEGGIVVFGDEELAARFRAWTNFGFMGSRAAQSAGLNAKMAEVQAAYVHAALDGWEVEREEWASARRLVRALSREFGLDTFEASNDGIDPYWIVRFRDAATCDTFEASLAVEGIETRRWWSRGCHRMPAYEHLPSRSLKVTDDIASRYLGLPFFRGIEDQHQNRLRDGLTDTMRMLR